MSAYPCSGEINRTINNPAAAISRVEQHFENSDAVVDRTDGLSMSFDNWRFNLRMSNTEPVVRLNVETAKDPGLMTERTEEILALLQSDNP